ncbi:MULTISPECIES: HAD family phosphatase [unclassified Chelatococcus]|nr:MULTISPECIES: HAD-IA family hydrolase [unclassified Chelatococcus]ALA17294.1 haloacid dehalogenase [Chelatococcus sp. CO-6]
MSRPAFLFDLDGTLTETDHLHFEAFNAMLAGFGRSITPEAYAREVQGRANAAIMRDMFPDLPESEHIRLADAKEAAFRTMAESQLQPARGLLDFLALAEGRAIGCAVVTNAPRANAEMMLGAIGLGRRFEAIVIGDELPRPKPDPLPYRMGLDLLRADAARSLAFEDSASGVQSAHAAGLFVVGLMTTLSAEALEAAGASLAIADFTDPRLMEVLDARLGGSP